MKSQSFDQKRWTNRFEKMPILLFFFFNLCFHSLEWLFFYVKRQNRSFTIYYHDLLHNETGGYRGLQGVTGDYKKMF